MKFADLSLQLAAARAMELPVLGITFSVVLPTDFSVRVAFEENRDAAGRPQQAKAFRAMLLQSVKGWSGATGRHVLPSAAEESLDFSVDALQALLDARLDIADALATEILVRRRGRLEHQEEAAKN